MLSLSAESVERTSLLSDLRKEAAAGAHGFYDYDVWEHLRVAEGSATVALTIAERLRRDYAALRWPDIALDPTVSIGVAMASEAGRDLLALLANADRALYRAKADGRNRVAPAPLVLVEATGGDIVRRTADCPPPAVPAPVAG